MIIKGTLVEREQVRWERDNKKGDGDKNDQNTSFVYENSIMKPTKN
jgi:hypothetical protein